MSEPTRTFQFLNRTGSVNLTASEIPETNARIIQFSEKTQTPFTNFKELFFALLDFTENQSEIQPATPAVLPENAIVLEENQCVFQETEETREALFDFIGKFPEPGGKVPRYDEIFVSAVTKSLNPEVTEVIKEVPVPTSVAPGPNDIAFTLSDDEAKLVDYVAQARAKYHEIPVATRSEMVRELALTKSTITNLGGGFYTGM